MPSPFFSRCIRRSLTALACAAAAFHASAGDDANRTGITALREAIADHGVEVSGSYVGEFLGNFAGGLRRGGGYEGLLTLQLDVDAEKLVHWNGAAFRVSMIDPHGRGLTDRYVGDLGVVSSIDAYDSVRLWEAWFEQRAFDGKLSLRAGMLAVDTEFSGCESEAVFLNASFGFPTAVGGNLPSPSYPLSALGVRLRAEPTPQWTLLLGVFDGNPAPGAIGDPSPRARLSTEENKWSTHPALRAGEGALLAGEVSFHSASIEADAKDATHPLAWNCKLGAFYHTDSFADVGDVDGERWIGSLWSRGPRAARTEFLSQLHRGRDRLPRAFSKRCARHRGDRRLVDGGEFARECRAPRRR